MENHNPPLPNSQPINYSTGIAPEQTTARVFDTLEIAATVLSLIATGLMLWGNRFPRAEFAVGALSVLVWIIAIFIWLAAISHFLLFALNAPRFLPSPRKLLLRAVTPLLLLATFVAVHLDIPAHIMFSLNRHALTAWAKSTLAPATTAPAAPMPQATVGGYTLWHIEPVRTGGIQFYIRGSGFFRTTSGYAYCPNSPPKDTYTDFYTPIGNGWYVRIYDGG